MKIIITIILLSLWMGSCTSSKIVNDWTSPETHYFEANKVLVIGVAQDGELRRQFETMLVSHLEKNGIVAVRSIDFFEFAFTDERKTEAELNTVEEQLLEAGFDAILFSKIIGVEEKVTTVQNMRELSHRFLRFKDDYFQSQELYDTKNNCESYKLYHAQTNLYCICPSKERELLWSVNIDIVENKNRKKSVRDYVKTLLSTLEEKQLLIVTL